MAVRARTLDRANDSPRDLLVSGHVNVDRFLALEEFPSPDRTVPVVAYREELGGTAWNIARTAARYGVRSGLVTRIGGDFPSEFSVAMRSSGIDLRGVERTEGIRTPSAYILEDAQGRQRTLMDQGAMDAPPTAPPARPWLREYSWVHLTTGPPEYQLSLQRQARALGLRIAADPAQEVHYRWGRERLRTLLAGSEILFGNLSEITRVARLLSVPRVESLVERVPLVVRTEGPRGATAFARTGSVHVPSVRPRRIRTVVGAGDSFRGGFYSAWFAGAELAACLRAGTRAAARGMEGTQ